MKWFLVWSFFGYSMNIFYSAEGTNGKQRKNSGKLLLPNHHQLECGLFISDRPLTQPTATAEEEEYPWLAILEYRVMNKLVPRCGGTLINQRYILTAASCLDNKEQPGKLEYVILGEHDTSNNKECYPYFKECREATLRYEMETKNVHPLYKSGLPLHNIGLLRLKKIVEYNIFIKPICMPPENYDKEVKKFVVAGWGIDKTGIGKRTKEIFVGLQALNNEQCSIALQVHVDDSQICTAREANRKSCQGDVGGPLTTAYFTGPMYQIGIINTIDKQCRIGRSVNTYTSVLKHLTWIYDNIKP